MTINSNIASLTTGINKAVTWITGAAFGSIGWLMSNVKLLIAIAFIVLVGLLIYTRFIKKKKTPGTKAIPSTVEYNPPEKDIRAEMKRIKTEVDYDPLEEEFGEAIK